MKNYLNLEMKMKNLMKLISKKINIYLLEMIILIELLFLIKKIKNFILNQMENLLIQLIWI